MKNGLEKSLMIKKMYEPPKYVQLRIQISALKGEHSRLAEKFNEYHTTNRRRSDQYAALYKALRNLHTTMQKVSWELYTFKLRPKYKKNFLK